MADVEIVRAGRRAEHKEFVLRFELVSVAGAGYSFPCDWHGKVKEYKLCPEAQANLARCRAGYDEQGRMIAHRGVEKLSWFYSIPAVIRCGCGRKLTLDSPWTNSCTHCHREYNGSGQRLDGNWRSNAWEDGRDDDE